MQRWQQLAQAKEASILSSIPQTWRIKTPSAKEQKDVTGPFINQFLASHEIEITESDACTIIEKVSAGEWTAVSVVRSFCHRASLAHQLTNCLHETFFDTALEEAARLDEYFNLNHKTTGPLHGLPISLKDQFHIRNTETTMGYVGWIGTFEGKEPPNEKNATFESDITASLRRLGAVFYCKTSVPHSLMSGETVNNIIGYTYNPKNRLLSAGGSSGGEGALIGLRGSPLGFGTDIGGSIRVPAAFNGTFGLRPSVGRLPYRGVPISMDGQESVPCVMGPMATTIRSLRMIFRAMLDTEPWKHNPGVIRLPWRNEEVEFFSELHKADSKGGKLSIGIFADDGVVCPDSTIRRALNMVKKSLKAAGHEIIPWNPPSHEEAWDIAYSTWLFDGGQDIHASLALSGEPIAPQISRAFGPFPTPEKSASHIAATNIRVRNYRERYHDYWNNTGTTRPVDAFISPVAPFAAARPGCYNHNSYSTIVNLLDYSAVAIPVTMADKAIDLAEENHDPVSPKDAECHGNYDPDIYHGAHVGVQVVTRRLEEEKALAIAEYITSLLRGRTASTRS